MLGILITVAVIAVVAYCVLKNYYPPIVLLLAGLLMLVCAWLMGVDPVDAKKSTNFVGFDFVQAFTNRMKGAFPASASTSCSSRASPSTWTASAPPRRS